jgi:hypothetical protein
MVMAYLFKNTPLQTNVIVNLTCLIPTENAEVGRPERLDLKAILWHFLHFRLEVVTNRLEHELESLQKRVHVLEGFEKVFDALDEIIRIIRKSDGKADSAAKIMKRFELDAEQTTRSSSSSSIAWRAWRSWSSRTSWPTSASALVRSRRCSKTKKRAGRSSATRSARSRSGTARTTNAARSSNRKEDGRLHRGRLHRRRRQRRHRVA